MGWLENWLYRKSHVVEPSAGAGTKYQIKIIAHYGSGVDSGGDVYLSGKCRTDFGDVRFTDDDGTTLLDYWIEEKVDGNYAVFWVEVADDLSINPATIYVYYGKSDATTTSNGTNTFIAWDDFDLGYSLNDPPKAERGWSYEKSEGDIIRVEADPANPDNKVLRIYADTVAPHPFLKNTWAEKQSVAVNYRVRNVADVSGNIWVALSEGVDARTTVTWGTYTGSSILWYDGTTYNEFSPHATFTTGVWYKIEDRVKANYFHMIKDGTDHTGGLRSAISVGIDNMNFGIGLATKIRQIIL